MMPSIYNGMKVKILGAGSIGNHLAQASRRMGWDVVVVDKDPSALKRMKEDIYPTRYGKWDDDISLVTGDKEPKGGFDIIMVGTPPHVRIPLAISALSEKPKVLQLEKPLCQPDGAELEKLSQAVKTNPDVKVIVGYDHAVSESIEYVVGLINKRIVGDILTLDVEFREHWGGIFKAHPWLSGPEDSYLGFSSKGGGASGEHSHALHLWQYLARKSGLGSWKNVSYVLEKVKNDKVDYDSIAAFNIETDIARVGRVIQDVVTKPTRKWLRVQGSSGFIEWYCGGSPKGDLVKYQQGDGEITEKVFEKTRPDDFYRETLHIKDLLDGKISIKDSPLAFEGGYGVMSLLSLIDSQSAGTVKIG